MMLELYINEVNVFINTCFSYNAFVTHPVQDQLLG